MTYDDSLSRMRSSFVLDAGTVDENPTRKQTFVKESQFIALTNAYICVPRLAARVL